MRKNYGKFQNKAVLLSIQPKWCELIAIGQKTVEVRKSKPSMETPFKCYIYCTKDEQYKIAPFRFADGWHIKRLDANTNWANGNTANMGERLNGKVIGEFVCDCIEKEHVEFTACANIGRLYWCRMSLSELTSYIGKGDYAFYWHISELKIYDKPKELNEFLKPCKWRVYHGWIDYECEARSHKVGCQYAIEDRNPDWSVNVYMCCYKDYVTRPPQSWCYVEEI